VAHSNNEEPWWHPGMLLGYASAYAYVFGLLAGYGAVKLGRIAIGRH
jgi:hypothetical protein